MGGYGGGSGGGMGVGVGVGVGVGYAICDGGCFGGHVNADYDEAICDNQSINCSFIHSPFLFPFLPIPSHSRPIRQSIHHDPPPKLNNHTDLIIPLLEKRIPTSHQHTTTHTHDTHTDKPTSLRARPAPSRPGPSTRATRLQA